MRILVIRFSSLGDVVLATAPLRALHELHPQVEIVFATKREYSPLLENFSEWLRVVPLDSAQSLSDYRKSLGSEPFDEIVDLHGSVRSRLLLLGLRSKVIRRASKATIRRFRMVWSKKGLESPHSVLKSYLQAAGASHHVRPQLVLSDGELSYLSQRAQTSPRRIGIGWGAKHPTKAVPPELWNRLLRTLSDNVPIELALFGLEGDRPPIERFIQESSSSRTSVLFEPVIGLSLRETISQVAACSAFVSSDSGLMHVADALGVPTYGLFGPTHPSLGFAPAGPKSRAYHAGTWCSPCHRHGRAPCFRERRFCFDELNVESIAAAVLANLESQHRVPSNA